MHPIKTRSYEHFCGLAFALDVVGERWALLVVRELLVGPRRYSDLMAGLPGVATNTLTSRLEELEQHGLISRQQLPPPAASAVYELTERGRALEPAIVELVRWARPELARVDEHRRLAPLRASWLAVALKSFFVPARAKRARGHVVFELPTGALSVEVTDEGPVLRDRTSSDRPEAVLHCREGVVIALVTNAVPLSRAMKQAGVALEGDVKALARVLWAFQREPHAP